MSDHWILRPPFQPANPKTNPTIRSPAKAPSTSPPVFWAIINIDPGTRSMKLRPQVSCCNFRHSRKPRLSVISLIVIGGILLRVIVSHQCTDLIHHHSYLLGGERQIVHHD